jgi:hypothetical protein
VVQDAAFAREQNLRPLISDLIHETNASDSFMFGDRQHYFFDAITFGIAWSSIASATGFLGLMF